MPKDDRPIINLAALQPDLYFLLAILLVDEKLADVQGLGWAQDLFETETRRRMIWVATVARGLLDLLRGKGNVSEAKIFGRDLDDEVCGEYWYRYRDKSSHKPLASVEQPLRFRQACNSVIHARSILPYLDVLSDVPKESGRQVYRDRITVRAVHGKQTTRAQIDIIKFVQLTITLANFFEEDDDADV